MRALNFTQWNPDDIEALSDENYKSLKSVEIEVANWLEEFLTAYGLFPDAYQGDRYIYPQELSPRVFCSLVDEEEYCVKFDKHTSLRNVKSTRDGQRYRIHTFSLRWIKLSDVPRIVDRYSDSIYQDKTPAQLHAVNQRVTKQREYIAMLDSIGQEIPASEIWTNRK